MIRLVPTDIVHADLWHKWRSQPSTVRFNPVINTHVDGLKERMSIMSSDLSNLQAAEVFQFFIKCDDNLVGSVSLKGISHMMGYGEIGYDVGEEFQRRGIGKEAVAQFVSLIFTKTALRRLFAYVAEDNVASRKLLTGVGFRQEGVFREHYIINGEPTNEVVYGLLRSEWHK